MESFNGKNTAKNLYKMFDWVKKTQYLIFPGNDILNFFEGLLLLQRILKKLKLLFAREKVFFRVKFDFLFVQILISFFSGHVIRAIINK
ncbi:hypothetical protein BpHYR1_015467 [Brachionus plicatilis]|uniref:Uncharacterized protein n=1 Tax=Brachionus plicatilis TaxID=10195 RepID=A0A3M7R439_BRAPC|nr:hypothetical protein BpHYR1_015467 [Brachionus plicatilis]